MNEFYPNLEVSSKDQLRMQKLVDGELNHESRSKWLSSLTDDSPLWRQLTLAFVEKQVIDEALGDFVSRETEPSNVPAKLKENSPAALTKSSGHKGTIMWLVGLASCLLVGVFIGSEFSATPPDTAIVENTLSPQPKEISKEVSNLDESKQNIEIDLADALSRSSFPVPNEFRRALMKAGYSLKDKQTLAAVMLPTGGKIELPIRSVDVTYVGLDSFQ